MFRAKRTFLEKKIHRIRGRMRRIEAARRIVRCLLAATLLTGLFVLAERLFALPIDLELAACIVFPAALLAGIIWSFWRMPGEIEAAVAADERLNLRERLSSAWCVRASESRMERAVVEDAEERAATIRVGEVAPYGFFREARWLASSAFAVALIAAVLPPMLLFGKAKTEDPLKPQALPIAQAQQASRELKKIKEKLADRSKLKDPLELAEVDKDLADLQEELEQAKLNKGQAIAKLSKMSEELEKRQADLADKMNALQDLKASADSDLTKELADALQKGNIDEAKKALENLKEKIKSGELSNAEKSGSGEVKEMQKGGKSAEDKLLQQQKLAKEVEALSKQLKAISPEMAKALQKASDALKQGDAEKAQGEMDSAAASMSDLAEALEQMATLSEMEGQVSGMKKGLARAGTGDGKSEGEGEGEWADTNKQSADWKAGETLNKGSGMGQAGRGMGGTARQQADAIKFQQEKFKSMQQKGAILAQIKVDGDQIKGDTKVKYEESLLEYKQEAQDTLQREAMPMEYKGLVSNYFDLIKPDVGSAAKAPEKPAEAQHLNLAPAAGAGAKR